MLRPLRPLGLLLSLAGCTAHVAPARPSVPAVSAATTPDWQRPEPSAITRAKAEHKLVLLSVQAEFCHWCHVMNDTTYRDPRVVALLRERFVTLRIDQAEDPALSARYADYGWPATAILTDAAEPVVALRGHQPADGFYALLSKLVHDFDAGRPLATPEQTMVSGATDLVTLEQAARARLDGLYDPAQGGWGSPQKYPFAAPVEYALERDFVLGEEARRTQALDTLAGHAQLIDPVAGGMYQYSLEAVWTAPHYEKLAEIQAGALRNFAQAFRATGETRFLNAGEQVANYVLTALRTSDGAFMASQHADAGELGQPSFMAGSVYYAKSQAERAQTLAPRFDRHVYADLNGMLIHGLVALWRAAGDARFLAAAETCAARIERTHRRDAAYVHEESERGAARFLSDQVEMIAALSALADATGKDAYRTQAYATLDFTLSALQDKEHGGFFAVTAQAESQGVFGGQNKPLNENARLARLLLARARREYDERFKPLAEATLRSQAAAIAEAGRKAGDALLALTEAAGSYVMFSVVGPQADARTQALRAAAYKAYAPHALLRTDEPGQGHYPYPGEPAIFLCSDSACSAPVFQPDALRDSLNAFVRAAREP
jgi:uncharacterized protein YyaL (SSP411 family)